MRDLPVFTTENGVGSLVLKEIPYRGIAYVTIHDASCPAEFVKECVDFCRAVGAETVYGKGHEVVASYPLFTSVIQMSAAIEMIPESDASIFPVTEKTLSRWCEIYNDRMKHVDNAAYMSDSEGRALLKNGGAYFVHRDGELLGIGVALDDKIDCVAAVKRGSGREVTAALTHALMCDRVILEVSSTNHRAIRLYESMGFIKTAELSKWYKIF